MSFVALLLAGMFVLYCGFFYLLALALQMGTPVDALRAGLYRMALGAAGTLLSLVVHIFLRLAGASPLTLELAGDFVTWAVRLAIWIFVATWVYRVTRWRQGKLALSVVAGLALNYGIDFGMGRLGPDSPFLLSFGSWAFRLC